jgi:Flp pilus assembly protein TadG
MSIEAVLLAPILMMLVLFVVHLGRLATTHLRLITVADQSARAASLVHPRFMATVGESVARENAELNELPCAALDVGVEVTYDTDPATVRVSLSCDLTLNGVAMLAPVARTVAATSVEVIDRWRVDE